MPSFDLFFQNMKATQEMSELRAAIEAAGASPALTHCTVLAGELATRIQQMETALEIIAGNARVGYENATKSEHAEIAYKALAVPEYPQPRSFGRSNAGDVARGGSQQIDQSKT